MAVEVEELYRQYGPMVFRRCRSLLKDEQAAAEAMQDVFVQVLRFEDRLHQGAPSSLLYRMATNTCLNKIRSRKRRPEDPASELLHRIASVPEGEGLSAARLMLERLFSKEQESTRSMAVMHLLDGHTLEEVAAEFDMSVSGVRKRLRVLRKHVKELEAV